MGDAQSMCCTRTMIMTYTLLLLATGICADRPDSIARKLQLAKDVTLDKLSEDVWLHTAWHEISGYGSVSANGLIVLDGPQAIMIDLPWTDEQTKTLFDWVKENHNATVKWVIPTHSHIDCAGGLAEAHRRQADSFALDKTLKMLKLAGKPAPMNWFSERISLSCGTISVELAYIGAGHTVDNIVAYIPARNVLFGGCMVKSGDAKSLGNVTEADLAEWPQTLRAVRERYAEAKIVVPGHGQAGGPELIDHTIDLLKEAR